MFTIFSFFLTLGTTYLKVNKKYQFSRQSKSQIRKDSYLKMITIWLFLFFKMERFEEPLFWQSAPISKIFIHIIDFEIDRPPFFQRFALRDRQDLFDPGKRENDTMT